MSGSSGLVCVWHSDARPDARRTRSVWLDRSAPAGHWLTMWRDCCRPWPWQVKGMIRSTRGGTFARLIGEKDTTRSAILPGVFMRFPGFHPVSEAYGNPRRATSLNTHVNTA